MAYYPQKTLKSKIKLMGLIQSYTLVIVVVAVHVAFLNFLTSRRQGYIMMKEIWKVHLFCIQNSSRK